MWPYRCLHPTTPTDVLTLMQLPHRLISRGSDVAVHEGLGSDRHSLPWITSAPNQHVSMASNAIHRPYTVLHISSTKVCACTVSVTYFDHFSSIWHARSAHLAPQAIRPTVQPIHSGSWAIHIVCTVPTVVDAGGRKAVSLLLLMQAQRVKYSTTVIVLWRNRYFVPIMTLRPSCIRNCGSHVKYTEALAPIILGIELLLNSSHTGNSSRLGDLIFGGDRDSKCRLCQQNPCLTNSLPWVRWSITLMTLSSSFCLCSWCKMSYRAGWYISRTPTGEISSTVAPSCDTSTQAHMQEGELGFVICSDATYTVWKRWRKCSLPLDFLLALPGFWSCYRHTARDHILYHQFHSMPAARSRKETTHWTTDLRLFVETKRGAILKAHSFLTSSAHKRKESDSVPAVRYSVV